LLQRYPRNSENYFKASKSLSQLGHSYNTPGILGYKGVQTGVYKIIQNPSGAWISYFRVDNTTPYCAGDRSVVEKWSDYEGNIWYKTMGTNLAGGLSGYRFGPFTYNELHRVSSSGKIWEYVSKPAHLGWPTEIDPKDPEYRIYYRQK